MIGKLKKGSSFGGCIRYVTGKDEAKILASDGVLLGTNAEITQSFELQRQLNSRIKKPVGHIALSFKPEDKPRLTDEFMAKIAIEYMQMMGIKDTQFIIVRHQNTGNPHCHIVYNRINNEGKLISDRNDYRRNEQVTKTLKSKYGLTYGTDKSKTNTRKLRNAERAKYEIHNAVKDALNLGLLLVLIDKFQANTSLCKFILELLPIISDFQGILDSIVNLVFGTLSIAQFTSISLALIRSVGQSILGF